VVEPRGVEDGGGSGEPDLIGGKVDGAGEIGHEVVGGEAVGDEVSSEGRVLIKWQAVLAEGALKLAGGVGTGVICQGSAGFVEVEAEDLADGAAAYDQYFHGCLLEKTFR
jgi:hypothetical protein